MQFVDPTQFTIQVGQAPTPAGANVQFEGGQSGTLTMQSGQSMTLPRLTTVVTNTGGQSGSFTVSAPISGPAGGLAWYAASFSPSSGGGGVLSNHPSSVGPFTLAANESATIVWVTIFQDAQISEDGTYTTTIDVSVGGVPVFFTGPTFTLVVDPGVPTAAPSLQTSLSGDQLTLSWTDIGQEYEVTQLDGSGAPISVEANGVTVYTVGAGTLEGDPSGVVGFFTADLSMLADIPAGTTTTWVVRGVNGVGASAQAGPWSAPVTVATAPGQPLMVISSATLAVTAGGDVADNGTRLPVATVGVQETNDGSGAGTEQGWSGVVVGPDGIVYATPNFSGGGNTLQPGGSNTQSYQQGMGGYSSPPPTGTYTLYVGLGQGYWGMTAGSRFPGALSNTTTATAYWP